MPLSHFWPFNIDLCYFQRWSLQWLTFAGRCVWHSVHCEPRKQTWQFACWPIPTWIVCVYSARLKYDLQNLYLAKNDKSIFFKPSDQTLKFCITFVWCCSNVTVYTRLGTYHWLCKVKAAWQKSNIAFMTNSNLVCSLFSIQTLHALLFCTVDKPVSTSHDSHSAFQTCPV